MVEYLRKNPVNSEGQPLELLTGMAWNEYLAGMAKSGVYGDEITLFGIASLYRIQVTVVSTIGPGAQISINQAERNRECILGHFTERNGEHYLCLERNSEFKSEEEISSSIPNDK